MSGRIAANRTNEAANWNEMAVEHDKAGVGLRGVEAGNRNAVPPSGPFSKRTRKNADSEGVFRTGRAI